MNRSTEGELVSTYDHMPDILHTLYFIDAQGSTIDKSIIYQCNKPTIRLEVNGRIISVNKTKHISSHFLFITDKISKGGVDVDYCPTDNMWCDILKNPNQGAPYRLDCSHLINFPVDFVDKVDRKDNHPALLVTNQDDDIEVLPRNHNIPKADPSPVRRTVLGNGLNNFMWDLEQVPRRNGFWGSAQYITKVNIPPHKILYIFTSLNVLSLSDSSKMVFLSFRNTNNVSGYLMNPFSWRHYIITIYPPVL